jgi:hypothetical protein
MKRTSTDIGVDINVDGTLYWQIFVNGTTTQISLIELKMNLKMSKTIL